VLVPFSNWLNNLILWNSDDDQMQNIRYQFDNWDNILNKKDGAQKTNNGIEGLYFYFYKYD